MEKLAVKPLKGSRKTLLFALNLFIYFKLWLMTGTVTVGVLK